MKTSECELYNHTNSKSLVIKRGENSDKRFRVRDSDLCVIEIDNVKVYDSGEYHCTTDKEYEVFYLHVKVKPSSLLYNNRLCRNNSENVIYPNEQATVNFTCHSYLQKNYSSKTDFNWFADGRHIGSDISYGQQNDDLFESESSIQVHFVNGEKEKEIKCNIKSGSEKDLLIGTFGMLYSTNEVLLADTTFAIQDRNILKGETKQLTCKGNGFPSPKDILMKKKSKDEEWEVVSSESSIAVTDSGTYLCQARNENVNGTKMENYITSNTLSFRNYDRELQSMKEMVSQILLLNQMISNMNATVAALQKKVDGNHVKTE